MNDLFTPFLVIVFIGLIFATSVWRDTRAHELVERWAKANGFRLIHVEECWFARGPFFWTTSKGQVVFRIEVRDAQEHLRKGWVRCGSHFGGLWSDQTDVRWE